MQKHKVCKNVEYLGDFLRFVEREHMEYVGKWLLTGLCGKITTCCTAEEFRFHSLGLHCPAAQPLATWGSVNLNLN